MLDYMNMNKSRCVKGMFQFLLLHPGFRVKQTKQHVHAILYEDVVVCAYVACAWLVASACVCKGNMVRFDRLCGC